MLSSTTSYLEEVLSEAYNEISFLDRYPTCLFQSLWNCCYWYDSRQARDRYWSAGYSSDIDYMWFLFSGSLSSLVCRWREDPTRSPRSWLRAISPPQHRLRSHFASEQKMPWSFSSRLACSPDGDWLAWNGVQYSPDRRWLCIWDRRANALEQILSSEPIWDVSIAQSGHVLAVAKGGKSICTIFNERKSMSARFIRSFQNLRMTSLASCLLVTANFCSGDICR